jgi:hypothetical protein
MWTTRDTAQRLESAPADRAERERDREGVPRNAESHGNVTVGLESNRDAPSLSPQPSAHIPDAGGGADPLVVT